MTTSASMRVLMLLAGAKVGGAEAFFVRLAAGLNRAGVQVYTAIRSHPDRAAELRAAGVGVSELPFGTPWLDHWTPLRLRNLEQTLRPDIVLSFMNRASGLCPSGPAVRIGRLGGYYDLKHYRRCDHLIGITSDLCAYFGRSGWPANRIHRIANFAEERPSPAVPRSDLNTPSGVPLVLALGRLHPNKAFDTLLDALARLPGVWLWLAGEGPERTNLEQQAERLGIADRIRLLGWRTDVPALLAAADAMVVPSRHEPLGSVLMEALGHGVPLIAAASQGPRQVVTDGVDGLLVPVDDAPALAAAIDKVLRDREFAMRLVSAGKATYAERYSEAAIVGEYLTLFRQVIDQPKLARTR